MKTLWAKIKARKPELENQYLESTLFQACTESMEAATDGYNWLLYHYAEDVARIKEDEAIEDGGKRLPAKATNENKRQGPILGLVKVSKTRKVSRL
jgi:transcription elongation factor SPT6